MPIYTFRCLKCLETYEELTLYDETQKYKSVKCPSCKSKRKERVFSYSVNCSFDKPKESSKWENFSYRAGYNMEKAKEDRRNAETKSHMGKDPYNNPKLN